MSRRTLIVLNPVSAGGRTMRRWPAIASSLRSHGVTYELHRTAAPNEATDVVRAALGQGFERIVAVGGDGTMNEVVNGFFGAGGDPLNGDAQVALIPSGTGGDFRKSTGIPRDPEACAALLHRGLSRRVDLGRIDFADASRRFFINIADCGIGGEVVAAVNRSSSKAGGLRGSAVFLAISLRTLLTFRGLPVRVVLDGEQIIEDTVQSVVIANGRYFGGGMHIAPGADLRDGLFDVVMVGAMGRLGAVRSLPSLYRGAHIHHPRVVIRRASRVEVRSADGELLFDVEGEQIGSTPATVTCLPGAISLCVPS